MRTIQLKNIKFKSLKELKAIRLHSFIYNTLAIVDESILKTINSMNTETLKVKRGLSFLPMVTSNIIIKDAKGNDVYVTEHRSYIPLKILANVPEREWEKCLSYVLDSFNLNQVKFLRLNYTSITLEKNIIHYHGEK